MVQGQPIPESVQCIIVCVGPLMSTEEISHLTQAGECRVWGILAHFQCTGDVQAPNMHYAIKMWSQVNILLLFSWCILKGLIIVLDANLTEYAGLVLWQAEVRVAADSRSLRVSIHNMEDTYLRLDIQWNRCASVIRIYQLIAESSYGDMIILQLTHTAIECSSEKHAEYNVCISSYRAEQLVFVDKSSVDHHTTYHGRTWAIKGQKANCGAFFCHGKR